MSDTMKAADLAPDERTIQRQIIKWADIQAGSVPELHLLYHPPNGGHRHKISAAKLKGMGAKAGVPDLVLPVLRLGFRGGERVQYGGLYVELKSQSGRLRKSQKEWRDRLRENGQAWALCRSFDDARCAIMDYLDGSFRPDLYDG